LSDLYEEPAETADLLAQIAAGDDQALGELLRTHEPFLQQVLAHRMDMRLLSRVDTSDVIQEAYLQATKRIEDFLDRRPMPFRIWLRKTTCETMLLLFRKHVGAQSRSVTREASNNDRSSVILLEQLVADTTSPSGKILKKEIVRQVQQAVSLLADQDREILLLRTYEGLSNIEASYALEIGADSCRKRYTRALLRLRDKLADYGLSGILT